MTAESDKIRDSLVDQLLSLEDRLDEKVDDVELLTGIQEGIGRLLNNSDSNEAEIRRVLQERYENGHLRKETFQLVKSMLDGYVTEQVPTSPDSLKPVADIVPLEDAEPVVENGLEDPAQSDDVMSTTTTIETRKPFLREPADERVQTGSVLRDRYLLQEHVMGGSMGVVYKAMDRRLAEAGTEAPWVAIKILSPKLSQNGQALRALQQEAAKGRCLVHPNIVRFIDLDRDDDLYFIVMEWLEGRTLADILDSADAGSVDSERAFSITRQVGKALEYAHKCGIVHADVKPGNIMILPNGDAKLFDFGVARIRQEHLDKDPDFDPGILGLLTPAYSSMQVLTGEQPTPADDVFSLACLLYRLLAGYRVFGPRNAAEAAEEGMKPQRLEKLSDANWRVLKKALSYSRVTRFDSMHAFIDALDDGSPDSITVDIPGPTRFEEPHEKTGFGRVFLGLLIVAGLLGVAGYQLGWLEPIKEKLLATQMPTTTSTPDVEEVAPPVETVVPAAEPAAEEIVDELVVASAPDGELLEAVNPVDIPQPAVVAAPLVDFSQLPPPTAEIKIAEGSTDSVIVTLREDADPATVDIVRDNVDFSLTLRLEEAGFSGNRSPWAAGQYEFSNDGYLEFPVGQDRARVTLTMMSDPLREADQQSTLRIRESESANTELGVITVVLEDDDQRAFEATLPANTVAFATSQVSVNEQDPAVQLDIIRFKPGTTPLVVGYKLRDITATQGEDYFSPGGFTIEFGPGQRTARLLIPLVQDSEYEDNEAFSVELSQPTTEVRADVYRRVAVMIRDDDQ